MNKKRFVTLLMAAVCMFLLAAPAFAAETRSSVQINSYSMTVTPVTNTLNVKFSVTGNGIMNKLGCESIKVYEQSGSRWVLTETWDEDDTGMSRSNSYAQVNTIYCDGETDVEYKVVVTIFAENDAGRDTRSQTFYVTGK